MILRGNWMVADIVLDGAERFGNRLAISDPHQELTYLELAKEVWRIAAFLRKAGVEAGDRVAIVLPNSVRFIEVHFGILAANCISVPCDFGVTAENLLRIFENCSPRFLITEQSVIDRFEGVLPEENIEKVFLYADTFTEQVAKSITDLKAELSAENLPTGPPDIYRYPDAVASLMYTTGTTGCAKGVPLRNTNINAAVSNICNFVGYTEGDREVVILPLSHNFGLGHLYCNLLNGGAVYTENGLSRVGRVLNKVRDFKATGFPGTPTGFGMLIDRFGPVFQERCSDLRFSVINSAPLPPERTQQMQTLLPNLNIMVYYGLTEASRSTFISLSQMGPKYYRSVGRAMPNVSVQILGQDDLPLEQEETGEVVISGPTVVSGYWNSSDLSAETFKNGRMHTGDLGYMDSDRNLFISGRMKDFINVGGYKVNPVEVEDVIKAYPGVDDVGVTGIEGLLGVTGESVVAGFVSIDKELDAEAVERHCLKNLEKFKVPNAFIRLDAVPRTNTGKTKRKALSVLLKRQVST